MQKRYKEMKADEMMSLELSKSRALHFTEQNSSCQSEWKRVVSDLTNLGGIIESPPSSPLSISWSSSGSSSINECYVPSRPLMHHHVVTKLNFDSCVPQNAVAPHLIRAKVTRNVINCVASPVSETNGSILQEENCKSGHTVAQTEENFATKTDIRSLNQSDNSSSDIKNAEQLVVGTVNDTSQCLIEQNNELYHHPVSPVKEVSPQLSPVIVRKKHKHSSSYKKRLSSKDNICVIKGAKDSLESPQSPLLGTSHNKKTPKAYIMNRHPRKTRLLMCTADNSSHVSPCSPILEYKRRRKLNFENGFNNSGESCMMQHHSINLNLCNNGVSVDYSGELTDNLHPQEKIEHLSIISNEHMNVGMRTSVNQDQVYKPSSPVLFPAKRKCRRKVHICKDVRDCRNNKNIQQLLEHLEKDDKDVQVKNVDKIKYQIPDRETKEKNTLKYISNVNALSPSKKEIRVLKSIEKTPEKLKLRENINKAKPFGTQRAVVPEKYDRKKILSIEGIEELDVEHLSVDNGGIQSPEVSLSISSSNTNALNKGKWERHSNSEHGFKSLFEHDTSLQNVCCNGSSSNINTGLMQENQWKSVGQSSIVINSVDGNISENKRSENIENPLYSTVSLVPNKNKDLPKQNCAANKIIAVESEYEHFTYNPSVSNTKSVKESCITHDNSSVKDALSPTLRSFISLCKIQQRKIEDRKLPLFEVRDSIRQQVNTPKPYKLTYMEEKQIQFSFPEKSVSTLTMISAARYKQRLKFIREHRSKCIDNDYFIQHKVQENSSEKARIQGNNQADRKDLQTEITELETIKDGHLISKDVGDFGKHMLESNLNNKHLVQKNVNESQKESALTISTSEVTIENEYTQKTDSVQNHDINEEYTSQEISGKSSSSRSVSPVACQDISDCTTPTKTSTSVSGEEVVQYCDSAKKKRRPRWNKEGLAARLQKLLSRQHSSTRIWQHELSRRNTHWKKKGVVLLVSSVRREYSRLLLYCSAIKPVTSDTSSHLNISEEQKFDENTVSAQFIVVLDPACAPHLTLGSRIKIYPPWQTLSISMLNITLVLGVTCVEELPLQPKEELLSSKPFQEEPVYTISCACLNQGPAYQRKCQFSFPHGSTEIFSHLLPNGKPIKEPLYCSTKLDHQAWHGTITDIVARHGCLLTGSVWLQLRICKVFHYIDRTSKENVWSLLGRDNIGEYCEIILGSSPAEVNALNCLADITTWQVVGHLHRFTGFTLTDRRHKSRHQDLWSVLKDVQLHFKETVVTVNSQHAGPSSEVQEQSVKKLDNSADIEAVKHEDSHAIDKQTREENSQLFLYVLSPCSEVWEMKCMTEEIVSKWPKARACSLRDILQQTGEDMSRHSCLVKLLYATTDILFITDTSVAQAALPGYMTVTIKPSCFVPADVIKRKTKAIFLQDLVHDKGKLNLDKYSCIVSLENFGANIRLLDFEESLTSKIVELNVTFPKLDLNSSADHLVSVIGAVIGVDEETAFAWPVCAGCENDLLLEIKPDQYVCNQCKKAVTTYQKMSLEVLVSCSWLPLSCNIKVKLLQETILKLLPPTENNNQGYSLISVLGQEVGPLICLVSNAGNHSFFLEEIRI